MMGIFKIVAFWSIRKKLLFLLLVFFLPAASGIIVASGLEHRRDQLKAAENSALLLTQSLASQQEQIAAGTRQMLSTLAQLPVVQRLDTKACGELFMEIKNRHSIYTILGAATPDGSLVAASSPFEPGTINLSGLKAIKDTLASLDFSAGEYMVGKLTGSPSIHYSYPVLDANKNLIAILNAGFKLDAYAHFIEKAHLPENSVVIIYDREGRRLFRLPENEASPLGNQPRGGFELIAHLDEGTYERTADDGIYRIYAFKRLRLREGSPPYLMIIAGVPKDTYMRASNIEILRNFLILGFATLIAMTWAWFFGNFAFMKPINRLVTAAQKLGGGDMGTRTDLVHTPDELGQLASAFDNMASLLETKEIERNQARKALVESEERYRAVVEDQLELITRFSPEGVVTFVNEANCRYFALRKDEYIGRIFWDLLPEEERFRIKEHIESINAEQPVGVIEHRIVPPNDEIRWLQWVYSAIIGEHGQIVEYQGVGRDVTDLRSAQQALRDSEEQLRFLSSRLLLAQEKERKRIACELHDSIGSSLVAVKIGIENARKQIVSGKARPEILDAPISWLQHTIDEARRMMSELRPSILDDLGLIEAIGWYCRGYQAVNKSIRVEKQIDAVEQEIPENLKIVIFRIMQEALGNVAKYSNADSVTIALVRENSNLHFIIEDNGRGFDLEMVRAKRNYEGGLGLVSMQERAQFSGGSLVIESVMGQGTTVRACWPCP